MKTAMQELLENLQKQFDEQTHPIRIDGTYFLEKEKEQIIEARDGREISSFTTGKDYYDLNFNHHTELKPNSYTNFTPDNANAVAEYNEGLKNFTPHNANAVAEYNEGLKNFTPSDKAILLTPKGTLTIGEEYSSPSISFYKNNEVEDVVTIKYSKFMYKGEEVKDLQTIYDIIRSLTSIELPSDEEIEKIQILISSVNSKDYCEGFSHGIDYMKEQVLNQKK